MKRMELLAKCEPASLRETFLDTIKDDSEYQWMVSALGANLDTSACDAIAISRDGVKDFQEFWHSGLYSPGLIQENLIAAQELLSRCFDRRERIQGLESQAITLGLQYLLDSEQRDDQFIAASLHAESAAKVADLPIEPVLRAIAHQKDVAKQVHLARIAQHSVSGSALNFGERIRLLSDLYVGDLVRVAFRVHFAYLGLAELAPSALGIRWSAPPEPAADHAYLGRLIAWVDDALHQYSRMMRGERDATLLLDFSEQVIQDAGPRHDLADYLENVRVGKQNLNEPFAFSLSTYNFDPKCRAVIGVGALLTCVDHDSLWQIDPIPANRTVSLEEKRYEARRRRSEVSLSLQLQPPLQRGNVVTESWQVAPIAIDGVGFQGEGRPQDFVRQASFTKVGRISPFGEWRLRFPNKIADGGGLIRFDKFLNGLQTADSKTIAFARVGVRLYFRYLW